MQSGVWKIWNIVTDNMLNEPFYKLEAYNENPIRVIFMV